MTGSAKRFVTLILDDHPCDAPYMSTIWHEFVVVGETTACGYGYRVGALIALAMVKSALAAPGTVLEVEIFGKRVRAVVQVDQPLWTQKRAFTRLNRGPRGEGHAGEARGGSRLSDRNFA